MTVFLLIGIIFTLFVVAAGVGASWWLGKRTDAGSVQRRHREEARQLQENFEADEDFTRHFHRPTQNELLETLQALDYLTLEWERGDKDVVIHRFKNELAESFPALRKEHCRYPEPIADDLSRLFGKGKLSAAAMDERQRSHAVQTAQKRANFHAARAQANALHQMSVGPAVGPVAMAPGSLPFRVNDAATATRRGGFRALEFGVAAVAILSLLGTGVYYTLGDFGLFSRVRAVMQKSSVTAKPLPGPSQPPPAQPSPAESAAPVAMNTESVEPALPESAAASSSEPALPSGAPTATPATAVAQTEPAPPPSVAPQLTVAAPPTPAATPSLAQLIADSKARAIEKYPDLAVPNSEINSRFIFRYKRLAEEKSTRLQDPNWPEKLAEECAGAAVGSKGKKITQARSGRG